MDLEFNKWLDEILSSGRFDTSDGMEFNIRKAGTYYWSVEVKISSGALKERGTGDWPCFKFEKIAQEFEVQMEVMKWLQGYMKNGKNAEIMKKQKGLGVGIV